MENLTSFNFFDKMLEKKKRMNKYFSSNFFSPTFIVIYVGTTLFRTLQSKKKKAMGDPEVAECEEGKCNPEKCEYILVLSSCFFVHAENFHAASPIFQVFIEISQQFGAFSEQYQRN